MARPWIVEVHVIVRHGTEAWNQDLRPEQVVDGLRGRDHVARCIRRRHMRGVGAFELGDAGAPFLRAGGVDHAAAFRGIGLRRQPLHRHVDEIRIAAGGGAIGKGDLQRFGEVVHRLRGTESEAGDIVAFENVEHLGDVHAGGRGRRRPQDFPAAIVGAYRLALHGLVGRQILAGDEAAMRLHVIDQDIAERSLVQRRLAMLRNMTQRLRIFRLHDALAGLQRHALRQIDRRDRFVLQHLRRTVADAFAQIGCCCIAARSVLDRGLHHIGQAHGAEPLQRLAPGFQRTRHRDRLRTVEVFIADGVEHIMRRARLRCVGIGANRRWHRALTVDETMAAVGSADMRHAAADDADHHRFDHRQREQGCNRRVDGIAAGREHLNARARCQRMIADHHAAAGGRRLFLTLKNGGRALPPVTAHAASRFS